MHAWHKHCLLSGSAWKRGTVNKAFWSVWLETKSSAFMDWCLQALPNVGACSGLTQATGSISAHCSV
jgi:hypothetical protein